MPAPNPVADDRAARVDLLHQLIQAVGGRGNAARIIAAEVDAGSVATTLRSLSRWTAAKPRPNTVDAAPDYAIKALRAATATARKWIAATTDDGRRVAIGLGEPYACVLTQSTGAPVVLGARGMSATQRDELVTQAMKAIRRKSKLASRLE